MRVTIPRFGGMDWNMVFKGCYISTRKQNITISGAEKALRARGIPVYDAKDIVKTFSQEQFDRKPEIKEEIKIDMNYSASVPVHMFTNFFSPLLNMEQCQLITNSVVYDSLPESVLDKVKDATPEDVEIVRECILHSYVLDAIQKRLPRNLDVINNPGYHPGLKFGIKDERKITSLINLFIMNLNQNQQITESMPVLEDVATRVTLNHSDKLMQMKHNIKFLLCTKNPLKPELRPDEVAEKSDIEMPDIFPLHPLIHTKIHEASETDIADRYCIENAPYAPHTLFMACTKIPFLSKPEQFYGMSLVYAFSHAASYAREVNKDCNGDLETPVTLNLVHTNSEYFHFSRFQLNTLNMASKNRNFFWSEPWIKIFNKAGFDSARPFVEGLDPKPLMLLRSLF